jgi:nitrate reductase NapD
MKEAELHIASLIVRTRAEHALRIAERIELTPGNEVHAIEDGKIVLVIEAESERALADRMDELRAEPDVLLVSLVFHQVDS